MRKTKVWIPVLLIMSLTVVFSPVKKKIEAQDSANFIKSIGDTGTDIGYSIVQSVDGGYVFSGGSSSYGGADIDIFYGKLSPTGDLVWSKTLEGSSVDISESIIQTSDGGYALTGFTMSHGGPDQDIILTKINSLGVEQWTKTIGGSSGDIGYDIIETSDNGFAITGNSSSYGGTFESIIVVKLDSSGVEQWTKTIGGVSGNNDGLSIIQTSDGGYAITGVTQEYGGSDQDLLLTKLSSAGVEQWTKIVGGSSNDYGYTVVQNSDGGYTVAGTTQSYGSSNFDIILVNFNSSGIEQWTKTLGGSSHDAVEDMFKTSDEGYVVTGYSESYGGSDKDIIISKFDSNGLEEWTKIIGGASTDWGYSIVQTTNGGYALTGLGNSTADILMVKLDSNGSIADCTTQVTDVTITEADQTITEIDVVLTESNETVTESDEAVVEEDVTPTLISECYTAASEDTSGIEVNIADVIALDCGADVDFGTVTPGTPVSAETTCTTTTNAENGYTLQVKREDADTTMDHTTDDTANITDKTVWTGTGGTTDTWTGTGLGFSIYASSTGSKNTTDWGLGTACHDALNEYTGFPSSYEAILSHSAYASAGTTTSVCYRVDIPSSQKSGSYDGVVTYQVYTNP